MPASSQPCQVVPVAGQALAALPFLPAEDVNGSGLLPEGALGEYDGRPGPRKQEVGQKPGRVAFDGPDDAGLSRRARPELHRDFRAHEGVIVEQRFIDDVQAFRLCPDLRPKSGALKVRFNRRRSLVGNPSVETGPDRLGPAAFLAARGRQRLGAGVGDQIGREGPDVIGDVDVFGEAADRLVCLRQRGSALEGEVLAEGRLEKGVEGCDNPDVLLEQECAVRATGFGNA